jgi:L-fucose/D-arabinose isomerase
MDIDRPHNRLAGAMPRIGIRPIVDGCRGVRESQEVTALAMARRTARLLSEKLRHPNGLPIECIVPDRCIGGAADAARVADLFDREGVGVSLTVTDGWAYATETIDMDPLRPKAVWGFNGAERNGAVYLAAALGAHNQKGVPAFGIYGRDLLDPGDNAPPPECEAALLQFARAALAVATMRGKSYLAIGGISMGIIGSALDAGFLERYLGLRVETVDMSEYHRRIAAGIFDREEFARARSWVQARCPEGTDPNPPEVRSTPARKAQEWDTVVQMALITRDLMVGNPRLAELGYADEALGHNAIAAAFQGQRQWTDGQPSGDFLETILNTSFDWTGRREPYIVGTEGDALNAASMLMGHLLTGAAVICADVRSYWSPTAIRQATGWEPTGPTQHGVIHLVNSGSTAVDAAGRQTRAGRPAMKPYWEITPDEAEECLRATTWHPTAKAHFPGGGFSTHFVSPAGMPLTLCRLHLVAGLGPTLMVAEGWTVDLPPDVHRILDERTNPTWPTTWFVPNLTGDGPFRDAYTLMRDWTSNHGAAAYGHIGGDLLTLASMLRIPVSLHNISEERIFRPSSWTAFGAHDPQGADYRACAAYGPLYG